MAVETGSAPPTNNQLIHCSSEDLRRIILVSAKEIGRRTGFSAEDTLEALGADAARWNRGEG